MNDKQENQVDLDALRYDSMHPPIPTKGPPNDGTPKSILRALLDHCETEMREAAAVINPDTGEQLNIEMSFQLGIGHEPSSLIWRVAGTDEVSILQFDPTDNPAISEIFLIGKPHNHLKSFMSK